KRSQIGPQIGRGGGQNGAFAGREVGPQVIEVARIGLKRIRRATALRRHHVEKQRGQSPLRGVKGCHPGQCCCLIKRSGGTVTTISRGFGSTKVTSANMAAYASPAITPTTASNLIKLGMAASPCGPLGAPSRGEYDHFRLAMARAKFRRNQLPVGFNSMNSVDQPSVMEPVAGQRRSSGYPRASSPPHRR